jgi:hypothetical protein
MLISPVSIALIVVRKIMLENKYFTEYIGAFETPKRPRVTIITKPAAVMYFM